MDLADLLRELERRKVEALVEGERLRIRAASGAVTPEIRTALQSYKGELIRLLTDADQVVRGFPPDLQEGEFALTPIQGWFVDLFDPEHQEWATTIAIALPREVSPQKLQDTLGELFRTHDIFGLRMFRSAGGAWRSRVVLNPAVPAVKVYELGGASGEEHEALLRDVATRLHRELSIVRGPVMAVALCRGASTTGDTALVSVLHHVYDAYSLRMMLDELYRLCLEQGAGPSDSSRHSAVSYREFLNALGRKARDSTFVARALSFWRNPARLRRLAPLPYDFPHGIHTDHNSEVLSVAIERTLVRKLQDVVARRGRSIDEMMLFALLLGFYRWTGSRWLRVDLEHHGRDGQLSGLNLLQVFGPTNCKIPLLLDVRDASNLNVTFESVCDGIRETTENGLGFGLLRYAYAAAKPCSEIANCPRPPLLFNSLLNMGIRSAGTAGPAGEMRMRSVRAASGRENPFSHELVVQCSWLREGIGVTFSYCRGSFRAASMDRLREGFVSALQEFVDQNSG
jgi:hypothetical protein